ncbi:MAG: DMT family transporter [Nitrospirota bacterium]|jgi:drug/metabolite transporter (DMT)-like permease
MRAPLPGAVFVLAALFLWSSLGVVIRLAGVGVHLLLFYALLVAIPLQGGLLFGFRRKEVPGGRGVAKIVLLGVVSLVNTFTFFFALQNTSIAKAVMTHYLAPVVVAVLAPAFLDERLTLRAVLSLLLASVGLWILMGLRPGEAVALVQGGMSRDLMGVLAGTVSGFAYAFLILLSRSYAPGHGPLAMTFFQSLTMCLLLVPFVSGLPAHALWAFLVVGIVHSTLAPTLYFRGLRTVAAGRAAILGYLEPVCAILFGIIFLKEYPSLVSLVGGSLILVSGYVTLREEEG